ncbi:alanine racemase [Candidatus Gracilibacteria bacterium]|nr:alanine racemase [Candidatus Gracilibacteria bacterium]
MKINREVLKKVRLSGKKLLAVTKYLSAEDTHDFLQNVYPQYTFCAGIGENRIEKIREKALPRNKVHFIGQVQSRKIPDIVHYTSVCHSLCHAEHARLFDKNADRENVRMGVFLQVNISREPQKSGVLPEELGSLIVAARSCDHLDILGISALGVGEYTEKEKRKEFRELCALRDTFLPDKEISAGTSRDYCIALEEGIDIVRIGTALWEY